MRRLIAFSCADDTLVGSVDEAAGDTGVLIVSGGNEVRGGAHRGMATLAASLANRGVPAFRYDRRGVGDSSGENKGWSGSAQDLAAAVAAFRRAQPQLRRIVGFGNCDGATALALFGRAAGVDALVLGNPWIGDDDPLPPPDAVRARYARQLLDPAAWRRLLFRPGGWRKLALGLRRAAKTRAGPAPLADQMASALSGCPATVILAERDRTAQAFASARAGLAPLAAINVIGINSHSHSFAGHEDALADALHHAVATIA